MITETATEVETAAAEAEAPPTQEEVAPSRLITRGNQLVSVTFSDIKPAGRVAIHTIWLCDWADIVAHNMKWTEKPEGFKGGPLIGKMIGVNLMMEPGPKALYDYRFDLPISKVDQFKYVLRKDGTQKLSYRVIMVPEDAMSAVAALVLWTEHVSPAEGAAQGTIVFAPEEQRSLPLAGATSITGGRGRRGRRKHVSIVEPGQTSIDDALKQSDPPADTSPAEGSAE